MLYEVMRREREAAREISRARQISRMLTRMPGIEHADVVWDDDQAAGWNREAKSRATVYLKPKPGSEITPEIIRSVRSAVAGSKANLAAENVIVMDLDRRITYEATLDEPLLRQQDQQRDERAAIYRRRIEQLLQHRITSYNVCYTKYYARLWPIGRPGLSRQAATYSTRPALPRSSAA